MNKSEIRDIYQRKRNALPAQEKALLETQLFDQFWTLFGENRPSVVHLFLPQKTSQEPDTTKLLDQIPIKAPNTRFVAPYIVPGTKSLEHYFLDHSTNLIDNQWGIPEPDPQTSQKAEVTDIDMVLIPLLAFDRKGFRVGYGGGFYDRFLALCSERTLKVGLSLFGPLQTINDLNGYDIRMDVCLTPGNIFKWK
ncbi:5-formyltetrahydrofolate cyclo-ligase [Dyadobacter jejuensis]|uniref:5-formyltetrahydrofolate cyclo-ligase n=1 Tax=Dyadobacter jejuensis TaxID=1082580 RepID=A0A316AHC1_9BACT|nr:5-formyltetrahydrofolate cyclo-ligase [Dyadobacter jejuensis]PWJ56678.1 5-formyltetrahydrofolate cyclo-ligase [Dyadobacter jejuensis]